MPYDEININGERQLMRTEKFVDYHPEFDAFLRGEGITNVLGQLLSHQPFSHSISEDLCWY
jgi:hypothetical protein